MITRIINILGSLSRDNKLIEWDYDKDIYEYGIDSLAFIKMVIMLEEEFSIEIPDEYLIFQKLNTINKINELLLKC